MKEDLSIYAMAGYIHNELYESGPKTQQYFTEGATAEDIDLAMKALKYLLTDDSILRRGNIFYLPIDKRKETNEITNRD